MIRRITILIAVIVFVLENKKIASYKTWAELEGNLKKIEKEQLTPTDKLVGVAMDFVYSNQTLMNLIANQMWNVGSVAIDKIVKIKDVQECGSVTLRPRMFTRHPKRDYKPSKWLANSAMDIWYGNKTAIDVFSREFADALFKFTMRPVRSLQETAHFDKDFTKPFLEKLNSSSTLNVSEEFKKQFLKRLNHTNLA